MKLSQEITLHVLRNAKRVGRLFSISINFNCEKRQICKICTAPKKKERRIYENEIPYAEDGRNITPIIQMPKLQNEFLWISKKKP